MTISTDEARRLADLVEHVHDLKGCIALLINMAAALRSLTAERDAAVREGERIRKAAAEVWESRTVYIATTPDESGDCDRCVVNGGALLRLNDALAGEGSK